MNTSVKQKNVIEMKNPRGYFLSGLMMIAMLLFAMGVQGNTVKSMWHDQTVITHSPPQQVIVMIKDNSNFPVVNEPATSYQIARGVSVPLRGLIVTADNYLCVNANYLGIGNIANNSQTRLRATLANENSLNNESLATRSKPNQLRGVNTRLDIGESLLTI